jgi:hypothetical protein
MLLLPADRGRTLQRREMRNAFACRQVIRLPPKLSDAWKHRMSPCSHSMRCMTASELAFLAGSAAGEVMLAGNSLTQLAQVTSASTIVLAADSQLCIDEQTAIASNCILQPQSQVFSQLDAHNVGLGDQGALRSTPETAT